jgi:hypothetical protein
MSEASTCHVCGRPVPVGAGYVVRIDVFADPELPPFTDADLAAAKLQGGLAALLEQMKHMSASQLQDGVFRRFHYRLCQPCHGNYLSNPLGLPRSAVALRKGSGEN